MYLDELLDELEELRGQNYIVCFDTDEPGLKGVKDIESIEIEEHVGIVHLLNINGGLL
jgi:hypothetical protein